MKRQRTQPGLLLHILVAILAVSLSLTAPALAAKPGAVRAAAEGDRALQAGEYGWAIEHYEEAWHIDPHPEYLLSLARAEHLAGKFDQALEHYRAFLAAPTAAADRIAQARGYAADIERLRLEYQVRDAYIQAYEQGRVREAQIHAADAARQMSLIQQAEAASRSGDERTAAGLYLAAHRTARDRDDALLYKAALASQYSGDWKGAKTQLEEYLRRAPSTAPNYPEAVTRLEAVNRRLGLTDAHTATPSPRPAAAPVVAEVPRDDDRATVGWTLVKIGGALALIGGGSYIWAHNEQVNLDALLTPAADGQIHVLSHEEAAARTDEVNRHLVTSYVLAGVGVAAAGVGTYLVVSAPGRVAISPHPSGAGLDVAVRF